MILKNRLKELRARDGLNQSELAKLAGVSRQSISLLERGEVEDRQNGELYGQQVENVEEQCRACVKVCFVFELLTERGAEKRHGVKDEVHDERRAQQPDEIGMLCGGVLQIVRQHDVQNERQRDGQNRQDFCKMLHGLGTPFNKKAGSIRLLQTDSAQSHIRHVTKERIQQQRCIHRQQVIMPYIRVIMLSPFNSYHFYVN